MAGTRGAKGLTLLALLGAAACAHHPKAVEGQQTADAGYIRFEDPNPVGQEAPIQSEEVALARESLRNELFSLESEIRIKKGQLSHLVLLNDPIWESQRMVLEEDIRRLQSRRAHLEAALMAHN